MRRFYITLSDTKRTDESWTDINKFQESKLSIPESSGFVEEQSASFPGRDEDLKTLFCLTNSLALLAARAAYNGSRQNIIKSNYTARD